MKQTNYKKVREFHSIMGIALDKWPPSEQLLTLRSNLLEEEFDELSREINALVPEIQGIAKELCDLLYVAYGTGAALGIDLDKVFEEVHSSNMSKLFNGAPILREDGKVLKGPEYKPPDLEFVNV